MKNAITAIGRLQSRLNLPHDLSQGNAGGVTRQGEAAATTADRSKQSYAGQLVYDLHQVIARDSVLRCNIGNRQTNIGRSRSMQENAQGIVGLQGELDNILL